MSQRREFVRLASQPGAQMRELCRRYAISPTTGYALLDRYRSSGDAGLQDRSRRPHHSPGRTLLEIEEQVLALRDRHPAWGGRKLRRRLQDLGLVAVPSASTITAILRRHDRLAGNAADRVRDWQRFERAAPNELWQMD